MNGLKGKRIEIQGYKHDGRMHRIWDSVFVVEENEEYVIVASKRTKVVEHDLRIWHTKEPAVMIFSKKKWWNVIAMIKRGGIVYYVNLASPFIVDRNCVKYIDYDLDIKLYPTNEVKLIDVKEYGYHRKKYGYGEDIDRILKFNITEVKSHMEKREFPFIDDKINDFYKIFVKEVEKNRYDN